MMNAIDSLLSRVSSGKLTPPAPDEAQRRQLFAAALRAADHGHLRPWRFLVIEGDGLSALGNLFAEAARLDQPDISDSALERYRGMPLRAPLIVAVIASCQAHPKVPELEQLLSAAGAAQNMLNAAHALGLGAIWRTGEMAYHPYVLKALGLRDKEQLVGYLYIGNLAAWPAAPPSLDAQAFFSPWPEKGDCV